MGQWRMASVSDMLQGKIIMLTIKYCVNFNSDSDACAIPDPDNEEVIITGGYYNTIIEGGTRTRVTVYTKDGYQRDLADLRQGRYNHACTGFIYEENKVILEYNHFH